MINVILTLEKVEKCLRYYRGHLCWSHICFVGYIVMDDCVLKPSFSDIWNRRSSCWLAFCCCGNIQEALLL